MVVDGKGSNELLVFKVQVGPIDFTTRDLNLLISYPHFMFPAKLMIDICSFNFWTCLKLAFMCHFSMVQGVLLLRQMSKTLFEKKVMNSLAEAELLMMLSSGRMMSLCLQKSFHVTSMITLCRWHTYPHSLQCGSQQNQEAAVLDEQGERARSPPDLIIFSFRCWWTSRGIETNLTLDTIVINIPQENELDIMVGLALLLHLIDQPLVIVRPNHWLVNQVLRGLQGGAAWRAHNIAVCSWFYCSYLLFWQEGVCKLFWQSRLRGLVT